MRLSSFRVNNFRRLKDVRVSVDPETTIFVGANNSGKTSATYAFRLFLSGGGSRGFSIHDFSSTCWGQFDEAGNDLTGASPLPTITLDLWFDINAQDLHRAIPLIPNLDWESGPLGVRLSLQPNDASELLARYRHARKQAEEATEDDSDFRPWPTTLSDYLSRTLHDEYSVDIATLDRASFDDDWKEDTNRPPKPLAETTTQARAILDSIFKVDFMDAQRFLSDSEANGKGEHLSGRLGRFYKTNLERYDDNLGATRALADSERRLNDHLLQVFKPTLDSLNKLGYPGFANPHLLIRSAVDPESIFSSKNTSVHYSLDDPATLEAGVAPIMLPGRYNGLGFKNLIYMVIELLDFQERWASMTVRPLLHLVMIEEPEAHLHAQLQQVFIRQVRKVLEEEASFLTQLVVTTHSSHIIYEAGFSPIRYFKRSAREAGVATTDVLDLANFKRPALLQSAVINSATAGSEEGTAVGDSQLDVVSADQTADEEAETRDFLIRYMKLTHCDLFFADAAVLVEGNVERLLLPLMIERAAPDLKAQYLSILEVGGAFAHRFRDLVNFLGITTLVITDLDSVALKAVQSPTPGEPESFAEEASMEVPPDESGKSKSFSVSMTDVAGAQTSNETLKQWLPRLTSVTDLLAAQEPSKIQTEPCSVRVAYQGRTNVTWNGTTVEAAGRTLEEAFAFQNLQWTQESSQKDLHLSVVKKSETAPEIQEMLARVHYRVASKSFKKTEFALAVFEADPQAWTVPTYIDEGLKWLEAQLTPNEILVPTPSAQASEPGDEEVLNPDV